MSTPQPNDPADRLLQRLISLPALDRFPGFTLKPLPRPRGTTTASTRYILFHQDRPFAYLHHGPRLEKLYKNITGLVSSCPAITNRLLAWQPDDAGDILLLEYAEGTTLEALVTNGRLTPDQARSTAQHLVGELNKTATPSSVASLQREIEDVFNAAARLPAFTSADQDLLLGSLLAWVKTSAQTTTPRLVWTNGDFIARNVIITPGGQTKLIDYEFALNTHFPEENAWRWRRYSNLPPAALYIEPAPPPWLEIIFLLKQLTLDHSIGRDASPLHERGRAEALEILVKLASEASAVIPGPLFLALYKYLKIQSTSCFAHLFWTGDGKFNEAQSGRKFFAAGKYTRVSWSFPAPQSTSLTLRLDPIDETGLVQIEQLDIVEIRNGVARTLSIPAPKSNSDLVPLLKEGEWLSVGGDPQLLYELTIRGDSTIRVDASLRCHPQYSLSKEIVATIDELGQGILVLNQSASEEKTAREKADLAARLDNNQMRELAASQIERLGVELEEQLSHADRVDEKILDTLRLVEAQTQGIDEISRQVAGLQHTISTVRTDNQNKAADISHLQRVISGLNSDMDRSSIDLQRLKTENERNADKIRRMEQSGSWRLTAPFRYIRRTVSAALKREGVFTDAPTVSIERENNLFSVFITEHSGCKTSVKRAWVKIGNRRIPLNLETNIWKTTFQVRAGLKLVSVIVKSSDNQTSILVRRLHLVRGTTLPAPSVTNPEKSTGFTPKVTVIVPNYNHIAYLKQRLDSIYAQTYPNFEVILMDDASTDGSLSVLKSYQKNHPKNTRLAVNDVNGKSPFLQWKKGIELASGDLVWIAESDDYCDPDFLSKLVPFFSDPAVKLSYCVSTFVKADGTVSGFTFEHYVKALSTTKWAGDYVETAHNEVRAALGIQNTIPNASSAIFRTPRHLSLLNDPDWTRMRVCGDWIFYLSIIRGGKIAFTRSTNNYYRNHTTNTSSGSARLPLYFKEHHQVAQHIARLYQVTDELLNLHHERLKHQWKVTFPESNPAEWTLADCYDPSTVASARKLRLPNVLIVCHDFSTGGGEVFAIRLAQSLHSLGFGVTFYDFNGRTGKSVLRQQLPPEIPVVVRTPSEKLPIDYLIQSLGIEVINTHHSSCEWMFAEAFDACLKQSIQPLPKLIATLHGMHNLQAETLLTHRTSLSRQVSHWVYVADKNLEPFFDNEMHVAGKFTKIPTGIFAPQPSLSINRQALGLPKHSFVVCVVSRAIPEKGWLETISAVERARARSRKNIYLLLIGNGALYEELKRAPLPAHVHLLGFREDAAAYFALSNVGVLASRYKGESAPLCVLECLSAGTPVVATDCGEIKSMLTTPEGLAGMLIPQTPEEACVDALTDALVSMATDADLHKKLSARAQLASRNYDMGVIAAAYASLFAKIVSSEQQENT